MYYFATALSDFLDLGTQSSPKNLWFASDGLASNQHAHPNSSSIRRMMSGYFRTHYVASGLGGGSNGLGGPDSFSYEHGTIKALPGTQVGMNGEEYPVYANSPDCIFPNDAAGDPYYDEVPYPAIGAIYNYAFEDGPFGGQAYLYHGVCATRWILLPTAPCISASTFAAHQRGPSLGMDERPDGLVGCRSRE
jgi:hypothetical protein